MEKINVIDNKVDTMKVNQEKIEKDIRVECGYILERLKTAEGNKLALLNHEMQSIQNELEEMKEVKSKYEKFATTDLLMPEFLACSNSLNKNIEHILSKPVKEVINVEPWELPHELKDIRESLDHSKILEETLKFKREIIWRVWQEKIKEERIAVKE